MGNPTGNIPHLSYVIHCMLNYARALRRQPTDAEKVLWRHLRRRQVAGYKFHRQHRFGPYTCDFVCIEASLIVEPDGSQHLDEAPYDARRDAYLRGEGFRVLRFWNGNVQHHTDDVLSTIHAALERPEMDGRFD